MNYHICPSVSNGKALGLNHAVCGNCNVCFTQPDIIVLYPKHGRKVTRPHVKLEGSNSPSVMVSAIYRADGKHVTLTVRNSHRSISTGLSLDPIAIPMGSLDKIRLPESTVRLFSETTKMQTLVNGKLKQIYSFNTTAFYSPAAQVKTCPAASLKGCGSYCYARQGTYGFLETLLASEARTVWLNHHLKVGNYSYLASTLGQGIVRVTIKRDVEYFRGNDAGDIMSPEHARVWVQAWAYVAGYADSCGKHVYGWSPSHSTSIPEIARELEDTQRYGLLVRPSYDLVDINALPDRLPQFAGYSGVIDHV